MENIEWVSEEKVYSSQTDQVQDQDVSETKAIIKDELQKDILLSAAKGDNVATTASRIKENAKKSYFKQLRKDIGTFASQASKDFINAIVQDFIKSVNQLYECNSLISNRLSFPNFLSFPLVFVRL